jgi:hypothetical protein
VPAFVCGAGDPHLVAEHEGRVIAWMSRHGHGHVHVCIAPEARGDGVIARMLAHCRPGEATVRIVSPCQPG